MFRARVLVTVLLSAGLPAAWLLPAGAASGPPAEPGAFAIRNARIVPVSGPVLEQGTVVVSGGLITAVGANVDVPADAWVIDGKGLTVYPGLIDALTDLGLSSGTGSGVGAARPAAGGGGGGAAAGPIARGPQDRPASTPWVQAADEINPDDRRLENWRNAGFTTALTAPRTGFFPGQGAVINLAGDRAGDLVVASGATLQMNVQPAGGGGSFPGALMGGFAYVRQVYLDVRHDVEARKQYDSAPRGRERPEYDRTVRAIADAQAANRPVLIPATTTAQMVRLLAFAQELEIKPVLYGVHEGYLAADTLAARKVPVLVSLNWPEREANGDPDAEDTLRVLRFRDRAPSTPAALQKAGVKFAFYSDGTAPQDLLKHARKAVEAGLAADLAVKAFTLDAAEILGVANRLGSIEPGKIANLVVTDGDLFGEKTAVKLVFVDGRKFEAREASRTTDSSSGRGGTPAAAAGSTTSASSASTSGSGATAGAPPASAATAPAAAAAQASPVAQQTFPLSTAPVTVIQNATILTVSHGTIEKGSILIRNGKIAEVGRSVSVPRGAQVIDAAGKYVMPGIIDCHSHIGVDGSVNEGSVSVSSMVGIEDVIAPDDINIYRALAGGVTTTNVLHGSANAIGGKNQVIKLRWGKDAQALKFEGAMPGIKFALGENPKRASRVPTPGTVGRYPATRMGVMDTIREAFVEAKAYQRRWADYRAKVKAGDKSAIAPARDLKLEPLVEVLEGKRLVHAHSYRSDEILQLIRVAEEMGFKLATLQHVLEGYRVADEIAKHGAGASTFSDWWAYKVEAYEAIPHNAALMTERGVVVSINSDSAEEDRHLNQEAAKAMKFGGLSETDALKLVTLNPAKQLRIDNRVGSIDTGKDADLVIYNTHPLSVYSVPEQVFIDGLLYFDRQKDIAGRAALDQERKALGEKTKGAAPRRPERRPPTETTAGPQITPRGAQEDRR